jgi:hypothetical protein
MLYILFSIINILPPKRDLYLELIEETKITNRILQWIVNMRWPLRRMGWERIILNRVLEKGQARTFYWD